MMVKILLVVAMIVIGQAEQDLEMFMKKTEKMFDDVKKLQTKVHDLSEENTELKSTVINLKVENSEHNIALNEELQKLTAENSELKKDIQKLKVKDDELVKDVSFLKSPPVYHISVYQSGTRVTGSNVPFEKTLYSQCNNCQNANFDLASGVYTNGWPGTYTVTWDLNALDTAGDYAVYIYLMKNGETIEESDHASYYSGSSGYARDQGGRTMILRMETGDQLSLYCDNCSASVWDVTFCISLTTAD